MKFRKILSLIIVFALCLTLTGCGNKKADNYTRFEDFFGAKVGVLKGKTYDVDVTSRIDDAEIVYFDDHEEMIKQVQKGKIDACVLDGPVADYYERVNGKVKKFPSPLVNSDYCIYTSKNFNFYDEAYEIIDGWLKEDTIQNLQSKWFSSDRRYMRIDLQDYADYQVTQGTLKVIAISNALPASYVDKDGTSQGYEVELVYKLAKELNLQLQIDFTEDLTYLFESVDNGKYDMGIGLMVPSLENIESGLYLQPTCSSGAFMVVKKDKLAEPKKIKKNSKAIVINELEDLSGKKVGLLSGSMFESYLVSNDVSTVNKWYRTTEEIMDAVLKGDVIATIIDKGIAKSTCDKEKALTYFNVDKIEYGFVFNKEDQTLTNEFNKFLQKITMNGTLQKLNNKWIGGEESAKILADYKSLPARKGTLKLATSSSLEPYSYKKPNGQLAGLDLDIAIAFCNECGYGLEIVDGTFDSIINSVSEGVCDFGGGAVTKTLERETKIRFSDTTYTGGLSVVLLAENSALAVQTKKNYSIGEQFYNVFAANDNWLVLVKGIGITLLVTVLAIVLGTLLGVGLSIEYISGGKKAKNIIYTTGTIFRRIPLVVWLSFFAYMVFGGATSNGVLISIIIYTCYFGFNFVDSVKKIYSRFSREDWANGYNLGFDKFVSFLFSTFSRDLNDAFAEYRSITTNTFKNTTLLGLIYVFDFSYACEYIRMNSFVSWIPIFLMIIFYFVVNTFIEQLVDKVKQTRMREKRSAADFNFGAVSKFSLEDDSENLFKLSVKEGTNENSKGLTGPIIQLEDVSVRYETAVGLDNVNVSISKSEAVAITGTNKSGVTTFFNLINGFVEPSSGKATTFGKDVSNPEYKKQIKKGVSIILRNAELFPYKNVIENVMYAITISSGVSQRKAYEKAYRVLFKLGLADKAFMYENELTTFEKKRALIARSLVFTPEILAFDNIDDDLSPNELVGLTIVLKQIKESGVTLLISSDNLEWLKSLTNRMLIFDKGKIIDDGPTDVLINRPEKPATIEFVSKSLNFSANIRSKLFDHVEIAGRVYTFAMNNNLSLDFSTRLGEIFDIIESEVIVKVMPTTFNMNMKMVYTKALNTVRLLIEYDGNDFDYINSMAVDKYDTFARLVESIHYSYDGINKYEIIIPVEKKYK